MFYNSQASFEVCYNYFHFNKLALDLVKLIKIFDWKINWTIKRGRGQVNKTTEPGIRGVINRDKQKRAPEQENEKRQRREDNDDACVAYDVDRGKEQYRFSENVAIVKTRQTLRQNAVDANIRLSCKLEREGRELQCSKYTKSKREIVEIS